MKNKFKSYTEYKNSGLSWLGKIPKHWDVYPNRAFFYERKVQNNENEELLSVTITKGVIRQAELLENSSKKDSSNLDKSKYKLVMPGNIAYNKMRMWQGAVGASKYRGIVSPAYIILNVRQNVYPWYYHFLFRTPQYTRESYRHSYGICDDQLSLRYEDFKTINSPLLPFKEQKAIVEFIKHKHNQIARFIHVKQRLIELLEEQKQVIINQAVTRGIAPNVRLKPSGVDWLGDIPKHWEVRRIKYLFRELDLRKGNHDYVLLSFSRKRGLIPYKELSDRPSSAEDLSKYKVCKKGDLLMNRMQAWSGMFIGVEIEGVVSPDYSVFKPMLDWGVKFYEYLFRTKSYVQRFAMESKGIGSGFNRLYTPDFGAIYTFLPPLKEQKMILEWIDKKTQCITTAISKAEREIELIREYRTRLIFNVVTGKIDVRDIPVEPTGEIKDYEELDVVGKGEKQEKN